MKYLVYGMRSVAISDVVSVIGRVLHASFEERDSSYKGGVYYRYSDKDGWSVSVESHWRDEDGILAKPEFSEYSVLVYLNEAPSVVEEKMDAIPSLSLLQSREF
ncbi:hypothetical protein ACIF83_36130 [Streptomyces sp. NPDC085866]|uniref:hypothetical protein n=1 Tax=Streptomyces sp. NPDC085866 TaxID=3365736 RepID=UPI0037D3D4D2